jgi:DNA repair protein RadD
MQLRDYQRDALERAREAVSKGAHSVLLQLATGLGKSVIFAEACRVHVANGGVPLIVTARRELVTQAIGHVERMGLVLERDVYVRSIQSLLSAKELPQGVTMLIIDEARHFVADEWGKVRSLFPDAVVLALDATPSRQDGRGLGDLCDVMIQGPSIREAIDAGYLVPCEVLRPERALGPRELAQDPVDAYLAKAKGTSAVIYASSIELAKEYADRIAGHGIHAAAIWGEMPTELRDQQLAEFASGHIRVVTNQNVLLDGWDAPIVETVILARTFGTAAAMLQAVGRGLRPSPGKTRCLVLDLAGTTHAHGEPDEARTWHLHGKAARRTDEETGIRWCPICGSPVRTVACETCGYAGAEMKLRKPRVLGLPIDRFRRFREQSDEQATKKLADCIKIARARRYKIGWALKYWSAIYGRSPTNEMIRAAKAMS